MSAYFIQSNRDNYMAFGDFTVTRASTKNVLGSAGTYVSVANNVPAFEFNTDGSYRGLLVEPGATNQIRNNSAQGAVAGSPGTLPTNWTSLSTVGLSREVVGTGTEQGVTYVDLRYSGTATSTAEFNLLFDASTQIVASNGQAWTASFWFKVVAQPTPPSAYRVGITERTLAGATVVTGTTDIATPTTWGRYSLARTLNGGGTVERVSAEFRTASLTNGQPYDFTIRFGWPQMETGSVATSPIVTTGSTASRVADVVSLTGASSLIGQTEGTLYCEFISRLTSVAQDLFTLGVAADTVSFRVNASNQLQGITFIANAQVASFSSGVTLGSGVSRGAFAYKNGDHALSQNGATPVTNATGASIPAVLAQVNLGALIRTATFNGWIRSAVIFPTRLPNATLQALTTL
jgi:hypothetical protein